MTPAEAGRLGGLTTASRHGRRHMAEMGARGFAAFAQRHCGGNTAKARAALRLDGRRRDWMPDPVEWRNWLDEKEARE